jgi:hypothetical protein
METMDPTAPHERTIMSVWPSISALPVGQWLGRLYQLGPRVSMLGIPFRPGWLIALVTIPLAIALYFNKIVPRIPFVVFGFSNPWSRRYRLTTDRVLIEHPFDALSSRHAERAIHGAVALGGFDSIELDQQPGQQWYRAADLVFRHKGAEVLRLAGVPHAEAFRQTCLKAQRSRGSSPATSEDVTALEIPA